ncbi:MAG: tetratricopeptide repeat protein [Bacteriovoracia bacterium]
MSDVLNSRQIFLRVAFVGTLCAVGSASASAAGPDPKLLEALRHTAEGDQTRAIQILVPLAAKAPDDFTLQLALANAYFGDRNFRQALETYKRIAERTPATNPLNGLAHLNLAKSYRMLGVLDLAIEECKLLRERPLPDAIQNAVIDERRALADELNQKSFAAYESAQYGSALGDLRKSLATHETSEAFLLAGMTLLKQARVYEARAYFKQVLARPDEANLHDRALDYLNKIRQGVWEESDPFRLRLSVGTGWNTNATSEGDSLANVSRPTADFLLDAGALVFRNPIHKFSLNYLASWNEIIGVPNLRVISNSIYADWTLRFGPARLGLVPQYVHQIVGASPLLHRPGGEARLQFRFGDWDAGAEVYLGKSVGLGGADYLTGLTQTRTVYTSYSDSFFFLRPFVMQIIDDSGSYSFVTYPCSFAAGVSASLPYGYTAWGGGIKAGWFPETDTRLFFQYRHLTKTFDGFFVPGNLVREDGENLLAIQAEHELDPTWTLYGSLATVINGSTLGSGTAIDKNYGQVVLGLGVQINLLRY